MGDSYREILVKRQPQTSEKIKKGLLIGVTAVCFAGGLIIWPLLLAGLVMAGVCYLQLPKFDVEYEYLYVNGELDVDAIYAKQKRKKMGTYNMEELELLAPSNSHALDSYRSHQGLKQKDYTSRDPQAKSVTLIINRDKEKEMVKVELDDAIVNDIRRTAPRKVVLN